MNRLNLVNGTLFTTDYLWEAVRDDERYTEIDVEAFKAELKAIFDQFPAQREPVEAQTEDDLIWPILGLLGWNQTVRQIKLSATGRENIPDGILFLDGHLQ